jgi:hypothetical protein
MALAGGDPAPDLQLSGPKPLSPIIPPGTDCGGNHVPLECGMCDRNACSVVLLARCDEECTARAKGKLTNVKKDKLRPASADVGPGDPAYLTLELTKKTRKKAGKAVYEGKKVEAKVTVRAKDAAGNVATAKRTIRITKHAPVPG